MILGLACTENVRSELHSLNFRGNLDLRNLECSSSEKILEQIEGTQCFTHVLFDADAVPGSGDALIQLLLRLRQSTTIEYLILLEGFPEDSRIVKELLDLGVHRKNILFSCTLPLRLRITEIALAAPPTQPIISIPSPKIPENVAISEENKSPTEDIGESLNENLQPLIPTERTKIQEAFESESSTSGFVVPPSEITLAQAHAELQARMLSIQKENLKVATQIAIAGAGRRIGTTTQALQILMHLRTQNKSAALVEMHDHPCLQSYADVYSDAVLHKSHCIINGNPLYFSQESLETIQKEYEYLILDFGNFNQCSICEFLKADVKIISCGIKPWETEQINNTFRDNDGSFQYLFSFVPPADEKDIVKQMEEFSQNTFFAPYSPDMFQYNGCDDMYHKLLAHSDTVSDL